MILIVGRETVSTKKVGTISRWEEYSTSLRSFWYFNLVFLPIGHLSEMLSDDLREVKYW